jgi:iron complex outermembrane receptor protein
LRYWFLALLSVLFLLVLVWTAAAQRPARPVARLDTVEVVGTPIRVGEVTMDYGGSVISVGRAQIEDLNAQDLPSALRLLPGVTISRYNLLGSYGGGEGGAVYIRGQGAGRPGGEIKVYVDGAPREVGVWSHPVMDVVPIDYASRIDVSKGPQPYSYAGTFGAVNLNTIRRTRPGYETSADFTAGGHSTWSGVFRHGGKFGAFDYYAGATRKESDGHREHADGLMESEYARLGLDLSAGSHLALIIQHTDNWSRDPGPVGGPVPERDRFATETLTHNLRLEHRGERVRGSAQVYYERGRIRWEKDHLSGPETPAGNSDTDWENYGFRGTGRMMLGDLGLTLSLEVEDEGGDFRNVTRTGMVPFTYSGRFTTVAPAVAAEYSIPVGRAGLQPSVGIRYYGHDRFDSEIAPHAGLVFRAGSWKAFASYARGVSYPGVYALGVSAGTVEHLEAEVLDHLEAGIGLARGTALELRFTVFRDLADNLMETTSEGLVNVRDYDLAGLEVSGSFRPGRSLSLLGAITVLDPDREKTPRAPDLSVSGGAVWRPVARLKLTLDAEYVDEQYAFNARSMEGAPAEVEKIGDYLVAGGGLAFDLSGMAPLDSEISLSVENLTDETYAFKPGYEMPGRTAFLGVRLEL